MTASEYAKQAGLASLEHAAARINKPSQTLRNWHRTNPELFRVVIAGCVQMDTIANLRTANALDAA